MRNREPTTIYISVIYLKLTLYAITAVPNFFAHTCTFLVYAVQRCFAFYIRQTCGVDQFSFNTKYTFH